MLLRKAKPIVSVLGLLTLAIALSGCASKPKPIEFSAQPINRPELILPSVDTLNMRDVKIHVITRENVNEIFSRLETSGQAVVLIAFTEKGYEAVSLNMADLLKILEEQKAVIRAYEIYYNESSAVIADHNRTVNQ